jgi:hypothetical protein
LGFGVWGLGLRVQGIGFTLNPLKSETRNLWSRGEQRRAEESRGEERRGEDRRKGKRREGGTKC